MSGLPPLPKKWVSDPNRDPPVYSRLLVGSELSMQRHWNEFDADGEVCFGINFTSSLRPQDLKDRTRGALDKLRFVCPIIACTIEDVVSPRWVYTPSANRDAWLNLALAVEERGPSLNPSEFVQSINFKRLPYTDGNGTTTLLRAYLLTTSKESDGGNREYGLYFHGSHSIIDGGPGLHALNLMCEWISDEGMVVNIEPLEEWRNLPVDPITATGGPCDSEEWRVFGTRLLQDFAEQNARTTPCHTLTPPSRPLEMSDPPFRYTITLSESETSALVSAAKKVGVTVSVLFHAAYCLAQLEMNPISGGATEVDFSSESTVVSLERYLKPPVNPITHFISSFTVMPLRFSMSQPLMERSEKGKLIATAKILQERFDRHLANPCLPHLLVAMASMPPTEVKRDDNTEPASQTEQAPVSPWCCAFNNFGVLETKLRTQHGRIVVGSVCIGNRLRSFITTHMWTMHSKFHFHIQGATAWGEECIKTLLEETVRIGSLVL